MIDSEQHNHEHQAVLRRENKNLTNLLIFNRFHHDHMAQQFYICDSSENNVVAQKIFLDRLDEKQEDESPTLIGSNHIYA